MGTPRDVTVLVPVKVVEIVGGAILTVVSSSVELKCRAEGIPLPEISWKRGEVVVSREKNYEILDVQQPYSGNYTCVATNIAGQDTRTSSLRVRGKTAARSFIPKKNQLHYIRPRFEAGATNISGNGLSYYQA